MAVTYSVSQDVCLLGLNNPPLNAINSSISNGLIEGIERAKQNIEIKAIVIYGHGKVFSCGADVNEFENEEERKDFLSIIENCSKPVIAAVHGICYGGAMEIALASHYRIAEKGTSFAFPEVDLGILPAWQGTQRFPRLVGIKSALDMIVFGKIIDADKAHEIKFLSRKPLESSTFLMDSISFAQTVRYHPFMVKKTSMLNIPDAHHSTKLIHEAYEVIKVMKPGRMAPVFCIKAIEAASKLSFKKGVEEERRLAEQLFTSAQAKALIYAFLGQRAATKWSLGHNINSSTVKGFVVKSAGVVGAGTMGSGIAVALLTAGIQTTLVEQNERYLKKGVERIEYLITGGVQHKKMSHEKALRCQQLLRYTTNISDLKDVDFVIEAVYEELALKKEIFKKLDVVCNNKTLLFSNTSSLDIDQIAAVTKRPDKVLGMHFFVPAYYMKLMENVRGKHTSPKTIATACDIGKRIGKVPVLVGNCHGFVGNRMMFPYVSEANFLVEEGALPHEVDAVLEDFGFRIGPFKVMDLAGIDINWNISLEFCKAQGIEIDLDIRQVSGRQFSTLPGHLVANGRLGRKSGVGWYYYDDGKTAVKDASLTKILEKFSKKHGLQRRKISMQEIFERCIYSLINEGFKVLEEGIASKPEDVDTIWLLGYGWPRHHGGPMFHASRIGLMRILKRIQYYHTINPNTDHWRPSDLLIKLAQSEVPLKLWADYIKKNISLL